MSSRGRPGHSTGFFIASGGVLPVPHLCSILPADLGQVALSQGADTVQGNNTYPAWNTLAAIRGGVGAGVSLRLDPIWMGRALGPLAAVTPGFSHLWAIPGSH